VYKIFNRAYAEFRTVYDEKYQKKYGFFRPVIDKEVEKYLKCGIFEYGFARIRCENKSCKREFLLPFSCKGRSLCSSCSTKHMLLFQMRIMDTVAAKVPHRHMVFCMPKALRGGFIKNRPSLNVLSRLTFESIKEFYQATLKSNGVPGGIVTIQTHGNMLNVHPHTHVIVSDGLFCEDGTFRLMPPIDGRGRACLQRIFEKKVIRFCLKEGMVREGTVMMMYQWAHTGFSVYTESRMDLSFLDESLLSGKEIDYANEEKQKISQMLRYVSKPFFSQEKIVLQEGADRILLGTKAKLRAWMQRRNFASDSAARNAIDGISYKGDWHHGIKRNFEYFSFTDFKT
jgi:hypothetical protein